MMVRKSLYNQGCTMRQFSIIFAFAAAVLSFAGCQRVEMDPSGPEGEYKYSFVLSDDTRAVVGDSNVEWVAGDQVGMFVGSFKGAANVDVSTSPKMVVLYSTQAIPAGTMAYAYFPYDADNKNNGPDKTKIVLSGVQGGARVSAMPLAGIPFKVEEEIAPNAQKGNGSIKFLNLGSLINFKIFSSDKALQGETVKSVQLDATKSIAGFGHLDLTAVDASKEESLSLVMDSEGKTVIVNEEKSVAKDKDSAEPFKMVILPGTFQGTLTVTTDAATYTKKIPEREFARSHSRTFILDLATADRSEVEQVVVPLPYEESFASGPGAFTIKNVVKPEALSAVWTLDTGYSGMKATASANSVSYDSEAWLESPWMDLTHALGAVVSFDHAGNYFSSNAAKEKECTLWALRDEKGAEWKQLTIGEFFNSWTFISSGDISLADYLGGKVKLAFKYTSTASKAGTWLIKNFSARIVKADPGLYFEETEFTADVSDAFSAPVLVNPYSLEVTYSSDDEEIARVDGKTGKVVLAGDYGLVTITANYEGDDYFKAGSASYTILVSDKTVTPETFFYESFSQLNKEGCSGGNDGKWTGSIANLSLSSVTLDEGGWTSQNASAAYLCAKLGLGNADGWMTTRTIRISGKAKLSYSAAGWGSGTNTVTVSATGAKLSGDTEVTLTNAVWNSYAVKVNEAQGEVVLTFKGDRFFLDEIAVYAGDAPLKPEEKQDPDLAFGDGSLSFIVEPEADFKAPELTNPHNLSVTYSSSDDQVAKVDPSTGEVVIGKKEGVAEITASFIGTYAYNAGSASYRIVVRGKDSIVVDVLDLDFTGLKTGSYFTDWSGKVGASGAVYAGRSAGGNGSIQLGLDGENSGIVTVGSGGKVKKISVSWNYNTANHRVLEIYGSNTPYESAGDLYDEKTQGKLLGTMAFYQGDRAAYELEVDGDYEYVGFRSTSGAIYLTQISISWQ